MRRLSKVLRQAVRKEDLGDVQKRAEAMRRFVGMRKSAPQAHSVQDEVRKLRRGTRLDTLARP
ncbi:MAG: hypothetical protein SFV54_23405 [Bryobacteraceae bacterium]|nr:hypothetical protein [Bryobacteraceae bacterium]